ncbi:36.4 kDa proline-rich protein-like isoform X2 [Punica granatum]|uniref:36.4 kDa proline-rich protein-like isoform X2 n=1 Tax=Punica granatum TaxID=22663 RepID=A0A6P8EEJ3_PUNGR|nr:36.4 kDa proline-rich protein-like isoform X2 [Punica granatum]
MWAHKRKQQQTSAAMGIACGSSCIVRILPILLHMLMVYSVPCDAKSITRLFKGPEHLKSPLTERVVVVKEGDFLQSSNTEPYGVGSPFTLPPFDSLPPNPQPDSSPPFCTNLPSTPQTPSTTIPSPPGSTPTALPPPPPFYYIPVPPILPIQSPPPSPTSIIPGPPEYFPSPTPPESFPGPAIPGSAPSSPVISNSTPPSYEPSPSPPVAIPSPHYYYFPAPPAGGLRPPIFLPPVIYPAPAVLPPPKTGPSIALWCVAKPSVPDPIIQEAMNYACGSGADCASIQPDGLCFEPNTLFAHASYAFNSYWQRTKVAGGSCSFGGTAMLVTVDPSYDGCHFVYY